MTTRFVFSQEGKNKGTWCPPSVILINEEEKKALGDH